jgi:NADH dehydrogenase/putative oxidoreductase
LQTRTCPTACFPARSSQEFRPEIPGGATDVVGRRVGQRLSEVVGQSVVVENRPGGMENIGVRTCTDAAPDGYTLCLPTQQSIVYNGLTMRQMPFDPNGELVPIGEVAPVGAIVGVIADGTGAAATPPPVATASKAPPAKPAAPDFNLEGLPRIVIVGAGFGGIACARALRHAPASVTLIDRQNYHLFQPLLYQVATAALSPADIAIPIRAIFRDQFNAKVMLATVTGVDTKRREVLADGLNLPYDHLVIATGATHGYFGQDVWAPFAPGLKRVDDATLVRRRVLEAFERAEVAASEAERRRLLSFVIVGGGPTGVELAGAIAELARVGMEKDFRNFDPATAEIILVQAGPRLLPAFPESLSEVARRSLADIGVKVFLNSKVRLIDAAGVMINDRRIYSRTVLWAAGVAASPAAKWLNAKADKAGRVKVQPDLSVPDLPDVYVIGDTALANCWKGQPVPGLAPAAKQGGIFVAKAIRAKLRGEPVSHAFSYRHMGSLATIGRKSAVVDFGFVRLRGTVAWWLWGIVHVLFLLGSRNRVAVVLNWIWSYVTYRASTRLITGSSAQARNGNQMVSQEGR